MKYLIFAALAFAAGCGQSTKIGPPSFEVTKDGTKYENFNGRLEAAKVITDPGLRNDALKVLSLEAALAGYDTIARSAVEKINDPSIRNAAAKDAAHQISLLGDAKAATEIAQLITDPSIKNEVLAKIAKGQ